MSAYMSFTGLNMSFILEIERRFTINILYFLVFLRSIGGVRARQYVLEPRAPNRRRTLGDVSTLS